MALVVELPGSEPGEVKRLAHAKADAGLILRDVPGAKALKQMVEAAGGVPVGMAIKDTGGKDIVDLLGEGCDFVVFGIGIPASILDQEALGKFLMIDPSLDQGTVRGINALEVDGVFVSGKGGDSFVAIKYLLEYRRFVELLAKPVIVTLPSVVTKAELRSLWQVGVDGLVVPSTYSAEALTELRKMIGDLPRGRRGRRPRGGVVLPRYSTNVAEEEEQGDEEEEDV